jgi:cell division protein FtsN
LPRTDDGEFELVLGNKQLLSVFFIMVVLLGVFFAMGYIAGRNSGPGASDAAKKGEAARPIVVDNPQRASPMPEAGTQAQPRQAAQPTQPPAESGTSTQPVAGSQQPSAEPSPEEQARAEPVAPAPKPAPQTASAGTPAVAEPEKGTMFLQVVATARPEAEVIAGTLSKRGYRTQLSPAPGGNFFRVLVGPLKDAADVARTRADLEKAGFKPIVRKF